MLVLLKERGWGNEIKRKPKPKPKPKNKRESQKEQNVKTNMFIHNMARFILIEKMPVSKDGIADHLRGHIVDCVDGESFFTRRLVADIEESQLGETLRMVVV